MDSTKPSCCGVKHGLVSSEDLSHASNFFKSLFGNGFGRFKSNATATGHTFYLFWTWHRRFVACATGRVQIYPEAPQNQWGQEIDKKESAVKNCSIPSETSGILRQTGQSSPGSCGALIL